MESDLTTSIYLGRMYSVKSAGWGGGVCVGRRAKTPEPGVPFPIDAGGLGGTEHSACALERTRLIWRSRSSQLQPYASVGRF